MNLYDITNLDFVTMVTSATIVLHVNIFDCETITGQMQWIFLAQM